MSLNPKQRKPAAIMFTDMVGYSALAQGNYHLALELLAERVSASCATTLPEIPDGTFYFRTMEGHPGQGWDIQTPTNLGLTYGLFGNRAEALKVLDQLKDKARHPYLPAIGIAAVYMGLGEKDQALAWLIQAEEDRSGPIYLVNVDPVFAGLHSDPRFHASLRKMNLEK